MALKSLLDRGDAWLAGTVERQLAGIPLLQRLLGHGRLSARGVLVALAALLLLITVPSCTDRLLKRSRCLRLNFRGEQIPHSFGLAIYVISFALLLTDAGLHPGSAHDRLLWRFCITAFAGLGVADDLLGDKKVKGLRGHLSALVRERRVTTGLIKAAGGLITALAI